MDVIEIKGCDSYLIKSHNLKGGRQYLLNGEILNDELLRVDLVIKKTDLFQTLSNQKKIGDYRRGDEIISLETFKSKTQYYDSDSSEEETLRAIANRKELSGFEPHYLEIEPEVIGLNVVAYISNTESKIDIIDDEMILEMVDDFVKGLNVSNTILRATAFGYQEGLYAMIDKLKNYTNK